MGNAEIVTCAIPADPLQECSSNPVVAAAWRVDSRNPTGALSGKRKEVSGEIGVSCWRGEIIVKSISFRRNRFPADIIRHPAWLYFRFSQSFRDAEELLAQQGIEFSYGTVRCWTIKFGPLTDRRLSVGPGMRSTCRNVSGRA